MPLLVGHSPASFPPTREKKCSTTWTLMAVLTAKVFPGSLSNFSSLFPRTAVSNFNCKWQAALLCCFARVNVMFPCVFFHKFQLCLPLLVSGSNPSFHTQGLDLLQGQHRDRLVLLVLIYTAPAAMNLMLPSNWRKSYGFGGWNELCVCSVPHR